ncbi:hypothetical protein XELAEV_18027336mg [Xenopus laevis]|uniref:Uncharacterized protein n=1 Tax=Xenopus laevis TaxID=8355 RepID=A0A974HJY8_XENLA|nr:hypothetical protein XELAEV_18027336mg [Xenopus laevis]
MNITSKVVECFTCTYHNIVSNRIYSIKSALQTFFHLKAINKVHTLGLIYTLISTFISLTFECYSSDIFVYLRFTFQLKTVVYKVSRLIYNIC